MLEWSREKAFSSHRNRKHRDEIKEIRRQWYR